MIIHSVFYTSSSYEHYTSTLLRSFTTHDAAQQYCDELTAQIPEIVPDEAPDGYEIVYVIKETELTGAL